MAQPGTKVPVPLERLLRLPALLQGWGERVATNVQSRTITITNVNEQAIGTDLCRLLED